MGVVRMFLAAACSLPSSSYATTPALAPNATTTPIATTTRTTTVELLHRSGVQDELVSAGNKLSRVGSRPRLLNHHPHRHHHYHHRYHNHHHQHRHDIIPLCFLVSSSF